MSRKIDIIQVAIEHFDQSSTLSDPSMHHSARIDVHLGLCELVLPSANSAGALGACRDELKRNFSDSSLSSCRRLRGPQSRSRIFNTSLAVLSASHPDFSSSCSIATSPSASPHSSWYSWSPHRFQKAQGFAARLHIQHNCCVELPGAGGGLDEVNDNMADSSTLFQYGTWPSILLTAGFQNVNQTNISLYWAESQ